MTDYEALPAEGHTVKTFRCRVDEARHSFVLECVTKGNKRLVIEFPSEGLVQLEAAVTAHLAAFPQARGWKSPAKH